MLFARVKLGRAADPAVARPATAEALLDLNGRPVHARVAARLPKEAVDLLAERLRDRLEHLASQQRALHRSAGVAAPGEWRHGDLPARRPGVFLRPTAERRLVRRRTFAPQAMTAEEAAGELALLDHDFHLFIDAGTGRDAVLRRRTDGSFGLAVAGGRAPDLAGCSLPITPEPSPLARTVSEAIELLDLSDAPLVFFVDADNGRGTVAYRRHDGHDGLVAPAD